ncbi:hypothetical protein [Alistipes sp. An66]|uniref:hypothetical protein n=1 Tax=Alistipes sp. An66 TaxID=1965650 RepID=UPI000B55056B|nr:hypothetical protein [Alistipes sp. An66]OUN57951.1 hypothetical protein B5G16_10915 [Alistipes sp. An66]
MKKLLFVFAAIALFASCSKDEDNNNGLLVGKWEKVKTVWLDGSHPDDEYAPGEYVLEFTADGRVYEYQFGEKSPYSTKYSYNSKTSELTLMFVTFKVDLSADELIMHGQSIDVTPAPYADYYRRIE